MPLRFKAYDASLCGYPPARFPVVPKAIQRPTWHSTTDAFPTSFDDSRTAFFSQGRYALLHALHFLGVDEGSSVLIPAYHCRTMIDPVVRARANVLLYPLAEDLSPDMDRLRSLVAYSSPAPKALLLPHYFGFPQDAEAITSFCADRDIALIEDCCHAYFGRWRGRTLGSWGQCAIGSPAKFFPCPDGGTLVVANGEMRASLDGRSLLEELIALYRSVSGARWLPRRGLEVALQDLEDQFSDIRTRLPEWSVFTNEEDGSALSRYYRPEMESKRGLAWSRLVIRMSDADSIAAHRRENFEKLLSGVRDLPNCRPLYSELPEGVVPYMFPLLIERPESRFHWLKHLGVPMYRWDDLAVSDCAVSAHYSLHLLHLPCHQDLYPAEMDWMLRAVATVVGAGTKVLSCHELEDRADTPE